MTLPLPYPARADIDSFYALQIEPNDWELEHFVHVREAKKLGEQRTIERLERLCGGPGSILEIGPAAGWLLAAAAGRGWRAVGIEASPKFQRFATEELGLDVRLGTIDSVELGAEPQFDAVILRDVLEHLYDPITTLRSVASRLKAGGYVVIETPNRGSLAARFYGLRWRQMLVSHLFYWTRHSRAVAVERAGLRVVEMSEPRYWDPNPSLRRSRALREVGKLAVRLVLANVYVRPAGRHESLRKIPHFTTRGRMSYEDLEFRIGVQPALGDVLLCVASR